MTYSIIGRCARTGRLGLGITTFSLAVGGRCEGIAAGIGVCKTQAFPNRTNDPLGINLLAEGFMPARVMEMFAANDSEHDYRQIAVMDRDGRIAAHTGAGTRGWSGHQIDADCVAFGNGPQAGEVGGHQGRRPAGLSGHRRPGRRPSDGGRGAAARAGGIQALRGVLSRTGPQSEQGDPAGRLRRQPEGTPCVGRTSFPPATLAALIRLSQCRRRDLLARLPRGR